jgi:hypothetical protein
VSGTGGARAGAARGTTALRVVCHATAELPLVVLGVVELARGWRPLYDNADVALRSYQVFSSHSPLVGHEMAVSVGTRAVFGPGPIQNWLLAVPVRIDPAQGVLWGSLVAAVAAVALLVEAAWSVGGWRGAAVGSGSVLVLVLARTDVALDVAWNVWFGLFFLGTTMASGLATATGRLRWWPVTVVAASVVVQCQAAFAPPAVAVCLLAPVLGVAARRRAHRRVGPAWLAVGLGVAAAVWSAPLLEQATGHPGNLTLLARASSESGPTIGATAALRALGGATSVPPSWVHPLPPPGPGLFAAIVGTFSGSGWWGVTVLALLAVIGAVSWRTGRRTLASMALLTLALAGGGVVAIGSVPAPQFLVVGYLGALWVTVGTAVWVTFAWAAGELAPSAAAAVRRRRRSDAVSEPGSGDPDPIGAGRGAARWDRRGSVAAVLVLVTLSAGVVWRGFDRMDGIAPTLAGWPAVHATAAVAAAAARVAPAGPFRLTVAGEGSADHLAVDTGVAYLLVTRGLDPRPDAPIAYATFGRPPAHGPTVVLVVPDRGGPVAAHLVEG